MLLFEGDGVCLAVSVLKHQENTRLAQAIRESGRTQREIADLLGVHPATISLYVSGRVEPPVSRALRLAVIIGRPVEELFGHLVFPASSRRRAGGGRR